MLKHPTERPTFLRKVNMRIVPPERCKVKIGDVFGDLVVIGHPFYCGTKHGQSVVCECTCTAILAVDREKENDARRIENKTV